MARGDPRELQRIRAALDGDIEAFEALVDAYHETVYQVALGVCHQHADADDIVQGVFVKIYGSLEQFAPDKAKFSTWLYRITVNMAIDFLRREARHRHRRREPVDEAWDLAGAARSTSLTDDPVRSAEGEELKTIVRAAIDELPEQQRIITILHEIEGLKNAEIAEILDSTPGNVRVQLYHARQKLAVKIRQYLGR